MRRSPPEQGSLPLARAVMVASQSMVAMGAGDGAVFDEPGGGVVAVQERAVADQQGDAASSG
jgi:hypothetical protein